MILIFTALLALSQFNSSLPTLNDFRTKPRSEIVKMYSKYCMGMLSGPMGNADLVSAIQKTLSTTNSSLKVTGSGRNEVEEAKILFNKICKENPDLDALDNYDFILAQALQKFTDIEESLPNIGDLKKLKLSQSTELRASDGSTIAEIYKTGGRRHWVSLNELPPYFLKTLVAVEDRRFFEHKGVDEIGILRAIVKNSTSQNRPEGGSTLTQQVAKNLFLDNSLSFERKIREILLAGQIESRLTKQEILEIYVNLIYFGRNSWGLYKASEAYFGKIPSKLSIAETAYLVGIIHGPNLYQTKSPRTQERMLFVLNKMIGEKIIDPSTNVTTLINDFTIPNKNDLGGSNYLRDYVIDELASQGVKNFRTAPITVQTTINSQLQKESETALQEGLIKYEKAAGRYTWRGPIKNILPYINKAEADFEKQKQLHDLESSKMGQSLFSAIDSEESSLTTDTPTSLLEAKSTPIWLRPLLRTSQRIPVPVSNWQIGVVLDDLTTIGLRDGKTSAISPANLIWVAPLKYGDLVYVVKRSNGECDVIQPPEVNGAVVVMNADTGAILAMVGGFNYALSSWNRAVRAYRQPGSLVKPWTYMSALQLGYQPNILLSQESITFPPLVPGAKSWTPKNYENETSSPRTMRWALEQSYNVMTAQLMKKTGLGPIRLLAQDFGLYDNPINSYSFILGSQETSLLSVVKAYAAIANGGYAVTPRATTLMTDNSHGVRKITSVDDITLFQIRYMLQGVVEHGTARRLAAYASYMGGKTGTTQDMKDAWFVGFTPNLVVGVYVGYDQPESLGNGFAGANVALPIFERIILSSFKFYQKPQVFPPPPPGITFLPVDRVTGQIEQTPSKNTINEAFRTSRIPGKK